MDSARARRQVGRREDAHLLSIDVDFVEAELCVCSGERLVDGRESRAGGPRRQLGVGELNGCSYVPRSGPRCLWSFTSAGPRDVETEFTHVEVDHDNLEGTGVSVRSPQLARPRSDRELTWSLAMSLRKEARLSISVVISKVDAVEGNKNLAAGRGGDARVGLRGVSRWRAPRRSREACAGIR